MTTDAPPLEAAFLAADAALMAAADTPEDLALLRAALAPQQSLARRLGGWPPAELPLAIHRALGGDPEQGHALAAACMLFFASADVIDDAQDGDLDAAAFGGWQQAVNAGNALVFLSQRAATAAAPARRHAAIADAFTEAGLAMSLGQRRDLAQQGLSPAALSEADYMATIRGKSGASFRLYAALPAIALGRSAALVDALRRFGEAFGMAVQLASDIGDLMGAESRDLRQQQVTLPILAAWQHLTPADRPLLLAAWAGEADAVPLSFLLDRSGALAYCQARLATLRIEAAQAIAGNAVPGALREAITPFLALIEPMRAGAIA